MIIIELSRTSHELATSILYIIAEAKRKLVPTIKEVLTNRTTDCLKFRHVELKKATYYIVW